MTKIKNNLSGKYFGTLSKDDLRRLTEMNSNRAGYVSMNEIVSMWRSGLNRPVFEDKNTGDLVYDAFK